MIRNSFIAIFCTGFTFFFMWVFNSSHHPLYGRLDPIIAIIQFSGPLLLLVCSITGLILRWNSIRLTKLLLKIHLLVALAAELILNAIDHKKDYDNLTLLDVLFIPLGTVMMSDMLLLILLPRSKSQINTKPLFQTIIASTAGVMVILAFWSSITPWMVRWGISRTAGQLPYCLQVRSEDDHVTYAPPKSMEALTGYRMQGKWNYGITSYKWQDFHALLIVRAEDGLKYYNWSYYLQSFAPLKERTRENLRIYKPSCEPVPNFISTLPGTD